MNQRTICLSAGLALLLSADLSRVEAETAQNRVANLATGGSCGQYLVFAPPLEDPNAGERSLEICPADPSASPFGWHDVDGNDGADFTDTQGNNVVVQEDRDGDDQGGLRPDGGPRLDFRFPLDLDAPPEDFIEASATHAFYWFNRLHDVRYGYGFDEASGNFQENNYGRGGNEGDRFTVDVQDPNGLVIVSTPPDGFAPVRFEIPVVLPPNDVRLTVTSPSSIAGLYSAARGDWGGGFEPPIVGTIELTRDASDTRLGCDPLVDFTPGRIALVFRGSCEFGLKALNAEDAGAIAVIIANDADELFDMAPGQVGDQVTIPAVLITRSDGATILDASPGVVAELSTSNELPRDGAYDNTFLAHGYGHGVSTRLTGGPNNSACLQNAEQMGEGWSDFDALWFTAAASDRATDLRTYGEWFLFDAGAGIRPYPYTTDLSQNPVTYADIATLGVPFGVGTVWAAMLWEVHWNLVDKLGFDPDLQNGSGGNQVAMLLVTDGLKLQPCSPSFVDGRDAILSADLVNTGGDNECEIWRGFAKRGLGVSAQAGSSNSVTDGTEAFDIPVQCGPDLNVAGTCPGVVTLRAAGLLDGIGTLITGSELGSGTIPAGPCAGTSIDIVDAELITQTGPEPDGTVIFERALPASRCGQFVQWIDAGCRVSPVGLVPAP